MGHTVYCAGVAMHFPQPNRRVIRRLQLALADFRAGELEDSTFSPARARAVADAAELILLDLGPQDCHRSSTGRDYERLGPDGERL